MVQFGEPSWGSSWRVQLEVQLGDPVWGAQCEGPVLMLQFWKSSF